MTYNYIDNNRELINWLKSHYEEDNLLRQVTPTYTNKEERLFDIGHGGILIIFNDETSSTGLMIYDDDIYVTHYELIPGKDKMKFDTENYTFEQPHFDNLEEATKAFKEFTGGEYIPVFEENK